MQYFSSAQHAAIRDQSLQPKRESLTREMKTALQHTDRPSDVGKIMESLQDNNTQLNIAITGESGSGKSTFVNAVRELSDGDEGAAPTGVTETTSEVKPYPHPNYPNVTFWDLPGIGTTSFLGFKKFEFFIIISDTRFRENDVKLAQEIHKMKKKFLLCLLKD
ncbi:unnamed protein product [Oreochromis niloticus]|nr:unnamed protein product [Mustela putorius furo]